MSTIEEQIRAIADEAFAQTEPVLRDVRKSGASPLEIEPVDLDARRNTTSRARLLTIAAAVLVVALVGGLLIATTRRTDSVPTDEPNGLSIVESLQRVPGDVATFGDLRIAGADFVALEALTGFERPTTPSGSDEWIARISGILESDPGYVGVVIPRSELFTEGLNAPDDFIDELRFSPFDVGRFITVEMGGLTRTFDEFTLVSGDDAVADAVDESGYLQIGTGELGERDLASRTPLRPLGEPMQLGFDPTNATVAVARGVDVVPAWLSGSTDSLMDTAPDIAAVAEQLDRIEGLTAFAFAQADRSVGDAFEGVPGFDEMTVIDRPFLLATGWSGIGASAKAVYIYAFADEQAAADATPSVEAAFAPDNVVATLAPGSFPAPAEGDPLTMRSIVAVESIETVGRTVIVTASPATDEVTVGYVAPFLVHE